MTTTYDPQHALYTDEADVRSELARVYDVCEGCRRCTTLCTSFPTMFELLEQRADPDASMMTPAEQDRVVAGCVQCKLCYANCPYVPGRHDHEVDFPRLMLRARAMQHANGHLPTHAHISARLVGRADRLGRVATPMSAVANAVVESEPKSLMRRVTARVTGISATRELPGYSRQRFSSWFKKRPKVTLRKKQAAVTLFPTCLVEFHATDIGNDLVRVYTRNGVECDTSGAGCCGVALLHAGDVERFGRVAARNVASLAADVRSDRDIVVPQPACAHALKRDYVEHLGSDDAKLVASHTYDAAEYLMSLHRSDDYVLDTEFPGEVLDRITYHAPCHVRALGIGYPSRDLMKLTGASVTVVQRSPGIEALWGYHRDNDDAATPLAERFGEQIASAGGDIVAGDCHLANVVIAEQTHRRAVHPVQVIARAYGIPAD